MKAVIGSFIGLVLCVSIGAEPLLEGRVRLESGEPVADAQVRLFDMTDLRRGAIARAQTDARGYFALPLAALAGSVLPERFTLGQNYPNPFNPSTVIPYQLAASSAVRLEVFNLLGQHLATLVDGERAAGFHTATWQATDGAGRAVGAGVYIYRMTVGVERQTGRMVLLDGQAGVSAGGTASVMPGASGGSESDREGSQVYGLIVSGSGLVPYVDSSFGVESGMVPVELVVSEGPHSAGKATDDDCALCDFLGAFNDQPEEEDETPEEEAEADSAASEGGPDLIVQSPSVSAVVLMPGQAFTLHVTVHNQGDEQAAATMLRYYRSNNSTITSSDTEVGTGAVDSLDASATSVQSIELTVPTGGGSGVYYGACVASVSGESKTDNNCSSAVRVTVGGQVATEDEETTEDEVATEEEGSDTPVTISDANLRAAIEAALGKANGMQITRAEMATLDSLKAGYVAISDLTGLENAANLTYLSLWSNNISDISPLSGLTRLQVLSAGYNDISDTSPLSGLTNLRELDLFNNSVTDVSPLAGLTNLESLDLCHNNVSDISALRDMTQLTHLGLTDNDFAGSDISVLANFPNLNFLALQSNNLTDISALAGLTSLWNLYLSDNNLTEISALAGLTELRNLGLEYNHITDISALAGLTELNLLYLGGNRLADISALAGLSRLEILLLRDNNIVDISAVAGLTNLTELLLNGNAITDIPPLAGLTNLTKLWLNLNNIAEISALAGLTNLKYLNLELNAITDMSVLVGLANLEHVRLRGNALNESSINSHIPALENRGAVVQFDSFREGEGDFDIELVFLGSFTERERKVLQYAARRWMAVITGDLPDYEFAVGKGGVCGNQSYEIPAGQRIDDLRIYVSRFAGDGTVIAQGWPVLLREGSHLPVAGCMRFRSGVVLLLDTAIHEIGHVLGFGSIWNELGLLQDFSMEDSNADPHFNGPLAIAAFDDAGGRNYTGAKVPVQKFDGGHWRNALLWEEIMSSGGGISLSAITVQSLADLGYDVDVTHADAYALPGTAAAKASAKIVAAMSSTPGVDVTQVDAYTLLGADRHWQGSLPLLPRDDRLRGRPESAEWLGGRGFDLRDDRLMGRLAPSPRAMPKLSCGVGLRREPIYVIDPQGRIIRTLGD